MERSSDRWHEVNLSRFVWEREGLDVVRRGLPDVSPIRAWANVEFVSHDGSINEVDLIVLTSAGLFLVELKAWSGRISGDGQQWRWTPPNATNHKFVPNPILATNSKAKKLRSLLNGQPALRGKCPRVEELVFLSSNDLDCQLLPIGRQRVFGRPAGGGGGPKRKGGEPLDSILDVLLGRMPVVDRGALGRITPDEAAAVARAVEQANIRPCQAERRAGDYVLTSKLGEAEELWEDWVGEHTAVRAKRRIRRWLSGVAGNAEYAARLARAANREFTFLAALDHPAVDRPLDYRETEYGPVLVYPYDEAMRPLATWLDEEGPRLTLDVRLDLIRQLAEVLQHAHGRRAYHRALSASVVDVVPGADGPQLRVRDWATGARESEGLPGAVGDVSLTGTVHVGELVADPSRGFLAPETFNGSGGDLDPVALDVFALGAVAYLILSGQAPAANAAELRRLLHDQGALDVGAAVDGLHETLAEMVRDATQANPELRCSIADVLTALDLVAEDLHPPVPAAATDHDEPTAKPTEAGAGDRLAGGWVVKRRLGKGSTAVAYLTEQNGREVVLKVAHEPSHHDRLLGEFEVLQPLDHPTIVRAFDIDEIEGHPALVLASAGHKTLAQRLREDLPDLSLLQRWGEDLLEALEYLEDHGVAHRDVKPENLGVRERRDGKLHLVLFDFSLSRTPADVVHVGTRAYLDPFLDERPSRRWDVHAERWSACVVLHEMATGQRPRWPGGGDPGAMPDVEVELDPAGFPEVIAPRLVAFFERALRRNPRQRFGSMEELRHAWSAVFADLDDTGTDTTTDADSLRERLAAASPGDALASLDLTPRVLDALSRLQAFTVGDLADVSIPELRKARGIGDRTRRQVVALLQLLPTAPTAPAPVEGVQGARSIDELARVLLPADLEPTSTETRVLRALLNLDGAGPAWPSQGDAAAAGGVTRARVSQLVAKARGRWKAIASISQVREDVVATLPSLGGVATTAELADTLLAVRGSSAIDPLERQRRALAALRAAVEAELSLKDKEPRIVERRRGDVVVIADDATGVEGIAAAEWALALGAEADRLVAQDPLPTAGVVLEALRAVELPTGLPAPTDQRLVRLAAACSTGAVASPRLDLHPSAMPPERAVVAARGVLFGPARIGVDAVHERVRARFPGAAPLPQRPELDALMAHIGMRWVPDHDPPGYGPEHEFARLTTIGPSRTRYSSGHPVDTVEQQAVRDVQARLERQAVDGGFCVWSVVPNRFNAAVGDLRQRFGAEPVDADALLLARLRAHAERLGVDWSVVLAADARPGDDEWRNLQVLVDDALADVRAHVLATGPVVVLAGLGLLARYDRLAELEAWRDHASGVRPVADARLATLWVVVPSDDPATRPMAAGRAVPVLGPNQYAAIPNAWIAQPVEAVA